MKAKRKLNIKPWIDQGFDSNQARSLAWAEVFEERQAFVEQKYQGVVDGTVRVDTWCWTCNNGGRFLPDTVRLFISSHKGHKTVTRRFK